MKKGFTLIEVNLAMLVMAGAVLSLISLYSLGFRESHQAREDLAAAALAERVINPLVIALSDPDMKWSQWQALPLQKGSSQSTSDNLSGSDNVQAYPANGGYIGWKAYLNIGKDTDGFYFYSVKSDPTDLAKSTYDAIVSGTGYPNDEDGDASRVVTVSLPSAPDERSNGLSYALVLSRESQMSPVITIAVRCVREGQRNMLMSQPVYATEVHFQGDPNS